MNFWLNSLQLQFRRQTVELTFGHVNFYWGKIGAGKTSIAKLIDFCLAANIELSPALQTELNYAELSLRIADRPLLIHRERDSTNVIASWMEDGEHIDAVIPARVANGIAVEGTGVAVLSDLIFHLAEKSAPMVRKGRRTDNERLERLSLRDIFRFCYVDQDKIDSDFFKLDAEADTARRAKSVDTMRYILGFHQDEVASLEADLQQANEQKLAAKVAAEMLSTALKEAGFDDAVSIETRMQEYREQWKIARHEAKKARETRGLGEHAVDELQSNARSLAIEIQNLDEMAAAISQQLDETERHINELKMLSVRFNRTKSARALLAAVDFSDCPRCTQKLPQRINHDCPVCGQEEVEEAHGHLSNEVVETDLKMRLAELTDTHERLEKQRQIIKRTISSTKEEKSSIDRELSRQMVDYDSVFLSQTLRFERQMASLEQKAKALQEYKVLPEKLANLEKKAADFAATAIGLKAKLTAARAAAYGDLENLQLLESFFLDCLVRSKFPGISLSDTVKIAPGTFIPAVMPSAEEDFAVTSFSNMSSGGMKTVFKACYALALHRVASLKGSPLPKLLILDSSMKNVSERENKEVFQSFYGMVYELAAGELFDTQFLLIDKEFYEPPPNAISVFHQLSAYCREEHIPCPSYPTFLKHLHEHDNDSTRRTRLGKRMTYQGKSFYYSLAYDTPRHGVRPFESVHIDHTLLDIELKCRRTGLDLGRPWLTLMIDAFSRRIMAVHLGFQQPDRSAVLMALRAFVKRWNRLPQMVVSDNGKDLVANDVKHFLTSMGVHIRLRPAGQPRVGSVMERIFGTLNTQLIHNLDGNTELTKNVRMVSRSHLPKRLSNWNLENVYNVIENWAFESYDIQPHPALDVSPREAFKRATRETGERPHKVILFNQDFLIATSPCVDRGAERSIDRQRGVKVHNFYYQSPNFDRYALAKKKCSVRYDPYDISHVYVQLPNGEWVEAHCMQLMHLPRMNVKQLESISAEYLAKNPGASNRRRDSISSGQLLEYIATMKTDSQTYREIQAIGETEFLHESNGLLGDKVCATRPKVFGLDELKATAVQHSSGLSRTRAHTHAQTQQKNSHPKVVPAETPDDDDFMYADLD